MAMSNGSLDILKSYSAQFVVWHFHILLTISSNMYMLDQENHGHSDGWHRLSYRELENTYMYTILGMPYHKLLGVYWCISG